MVETSPAAFPSAMQILPEQQILLLAQKGQGPGCLPVVGARAQGWKEAMALSTPEGLWLAQGEAALC